MTLCKYRPQRTYDAQFIFEKNDVNGLLKMLREAVERMGNDGVAATPYYAGALLAFEVMFSNAENDGMVDMWTDFMALFESALQELEGSE